MKTYRVKITPDAKADLKRYKNYLKDVKKSSQAAKNVVQDFNATAAKLKNAAASLGDSENPKLKARNLKRINFIKHDYFLLYRIEGEYVYVINMFHSLEDYENKLI